MHIFTLLRGIKTEQDKFINDLSGQWLPYAFDGHKSYVQVAVRPLQLVEIIFPKEHKQLMLNSIWQDTEIKLSKKYKTILMPLRKALGAKKIPERGFPLKKGEKKLLLGGLTNLARYPVGIREDPMNPDPKHDHEML